MTGRRHGDDKPPGNYFARQTNPCKTTTCSFYSLFVFDLNEQDTTCLLMSFGPHESGTELLIQLLSRMTSNYPFDLKRGSVLLVSRS